MHVERRKIWWIFGTTITPSLKSGRNILFLQEDRATVARQSFCNMPISINCILCVWLSSGGEHHRKQRYATTYSITQPAYNIWIDPKMAFGTGYHHTTYMMMSRLLGLPVRGSYVCDMGCGTAILGILAAKMGARKVFAVDIDLVAARSAWGNCRWNKVGTRVETACGDASLLQMGTYDILLANIHRNIVIEDMPTYARSLKRGGHLLLSGFFEADVQAVSAAAMEAGLLPAGSSSREGWACLEFSKK